MNRTLYIINPQGHGGAGMFAWKRFLSLWSDPIRAEDIFITKTPQCARERAAGAHEYQTIVAVGGDGTVGEVLSGMMERKEDRPLLAIIPAGTGNDIARQIGIHSVEDAITALQQRAVQSCDLIHVQCRANGADVQRYGFLFACAGFSPAHMIRPWMKRLLSARGAYYLATVLHLMIYRPRRVDIVHGSETIVGHHWLVMAANAEWAGGGGMRVAPDARLDDGELKITLVSAMSKFRMLTTVLANVGRGNHIHQLGVRYFAANTIQVESEVPVPLDVDGEVFGETPATLSICPSCLQILVPPPQNHPDP